MIVDEVRVPRGRGRYDIYRNEAGEIECYAGNLIYWINIDRLKTKGWASLAAIKMEDYHV